MKTIDLAALERLAGVVLLDFTAKWCPPCRAMDPVVDALAGEYAGRVEMRAVDVEDDAGFAQRFDVRSMPTFVLVRDGVEVGRTVGARPRAFLAGMIERAIRGDRAIASP
jgi:thioredoxin 1